MNPDREVVLSPEQYSLLQAELKKFEAGASKHMREWPAETLDAAALIERYPAPQPNRRQRRAMLAHAKRAARRAR